MGRSSDRAGRPRLRLALSLALLAGFSLACGRISSTQEDRGRSVAASFLDEVRAGRVDPAWQGTTAEFKSLMGSDSLKDYARNHPALKAQAEFVGSKRVETGAGRMVDYEFRATPAAAPRVKTPPTPKAIHVTVNFSVDPPAVERLTVE